ncbi:hypothetical protein KGY79_13105, partial [Candidatus Bipolaricaulota bacterium]|nr:hypothetical protein [Candidatus Bipolaricaulota bacterium]
MRKFIQIIGHLFVFAFFLTLALVPTTEAATYDLSITSTPLKVANPGEIVTHVFTVQNTGTDPDTYSLSLQLPEGWTSLPIPEQTSVPSGSSKPIFVNVNVPKDAKAKKYDIKLTVSSSGDPTLKATKSSQIQVQSVPGFELAWELGPRQIGPGMTVEAKLKIVNTGNLPDHYEFQADSPQGWTFSIKEESVQLMPGQSRILDVSFSVPVTAKSGERYNLEVVATSRQDKSLSRAISLSGILAPPPPEQVDGSLFPNWDVYTNLSASQTGEPSFYFSGSGTIPRLGDVSANLGFSLEGVRSANLRVMKDDWGFILGNSSISGSYEGISGFPLFISETGNVNTRVIFTEESKGLSVEWDRENCNLRGVLGSDTAAQDLVFHELQGVID